MRQRSVLPGKFLLDALEQALQVVDLGSAQSRSVNHVLQHRHRLSLKDRMQHLLADFFDALGFGEDASVKVAVAFALELEDAFLNKAMQERFDGACGPVGFLF